MRFMSRAVLACVLAMSACSLKGEPGDPGPVGATGATGATGLAGPTGPGGTNGLNALAGTSQEAAGANCSAGGAKLEYGLDANGNGALDPAEVNAALTRYVCNGVAGATGSTGATGTTGPRGPSGLGYDAVIKADGTGDYPTILAALAAGAKTILLKAGTHSVAGPIAMGTGTRIEGEVAATVVVQASAGVGSALVTGSSNNVLANVTLQGNAFTTSFLVSFSGSGNEIAGSILNTAASGISSGTQAFVHDNALTTGPTALNLGDGSRASNNRISTTRDGINASVDATITSNTIVSANTSGLGIVCLSRCVVSSNVLTGFSAGILASGTALSITSNDVGGAALGIDVFGASNAGFGFNRVGGNHVHNTSGAGIRLGGLKLNVTGNTVSSAGAACFLGSSQALTNVTVTGNLAQGCGGAGYNFSTGFTLSTLTGNLSSGSAQQAFVIQAATSSLSGNLGFNGDVFDFTTASTGSAAAANVGTRTGTCNGCKEAGNSWN